MSARAELEDSLHVLLARMLMHTIEGLAREVERGRLDDSERELLRSLAESTNIRAALALELARDWVKPRGMPERVQRAIAEAVGVEICRVRNVYISARPDGSTWVSALVSSPRECKACRARGSARGPARWEWAIINPRPGERVSGWETRRLASGLVVAARPCPACSVDGHPTGVER